MGTARIVFDRWSDRYADCIGGVRSSAVRDLFAASRAPTRCASDAETRHHRRLEGAGRRPAPKMPPECEAALDLVGRLICPDAPNRLWSADITYLPTREGWP